MTKRKGAPIDYHCCKCERDWSKAGEPPGRCPSCGSPSFDVPPGKHLDRRSTYTKKWIKA